MVLAGAEYPFWCIAPKKKACEGVKWAGCTVQLVCDGDLSSSPDDARQFGNWIKEIHRWGMMEHAGGCEDDIKVLMRGGEDEIDTAVWPVTFQFRKTVEACKSSPSSSARERHLSIDPQQSMTLRIVLEQAWILVSARSPVSRKVERSSCRSCPYSLTEPTTLTIDEYT